MKSISKTSKSTSSKKVYVGMSGGVDSSVAALLLTRAGFDVTGVFIKVWQPENSECTWKDERRDAMRVAAVLDIPFLTFDFSKEYKQEVVDYMISEYNLGRTPNPDVMCNRHVKFGSFLREALARGVDYVATGHYAQNIFDEKTRRFVLEESADKNKDQSYFLWTLNQDDLKHVLFPVGHLKKDELRKIAEKNNIPVFDKKDSQGVCFIGHLDMKEFLKEYIKTEKGNVIDTNGEVIGVHEGAPLYTVGERHGFIVFNKGEKGTHGEPHFIISKDIAKNTLTVAPESAFKERSSEVAAREATLVNTSWVGDEPLFGKSYDARIRYRQERQKCTLHKDHEGKIKIKFDKHQKGMAEGQSAVIYDGNICLGGGILS